MLYWARKERTVFYSVGKKEWLGIARVKPVTVKNMFNIILYSSGKTW